MPLPSCADSQPNGAARPRVGLNRDMLVKSSVGRARATSVGDGQYQCRYSRNVRSLINQITIHMLYQRLLVLPRTELPLFAWTLHTGVIRFFRTHEAILAEPA